MDGRTGVVGGRDSTATTAYNGRGVRFGLAQPPPYGSCARGREGVKGTTRVARARASGTTAARGHAPSSAMVRPPPADAQRVSVGPSGCTRPLVPEASASAIPLITDCPSSCPTAPRPRAEAAPSTLGRSGATSTATFTASQAAAAVRAACVCGVRKVTSLGKSPVRGCARTEGCQPATTRGGRACLATQRRPILLSPTDAASVVAQGANAVTASPLGTASTFRSFSTITQMNPNG